MKSRVTYTDPFTITGVDFTGALYIRSTEGEHKVYLCLFICATCRAVHLEIVNDLKVECFLQAFRRFVGRRSLARLLLSDNGSTFLAAAEELKMLLTSTEMAEALAHKGVEMEVYTQTCPMVWRLLGAPHRLNQINPKEDLRQNTRHTKEPPNYYC